MEVKSELKIYIISYIKELIKTLTREDGSIDAETLLKAIDRAFPTEIEIRRSE